jgi:hypothetical protein
MGDRATIFLRVVQFYARAVELRLLDWARSTDNTEHYDVLAFIRPAQQQSIVDALSRQSGLCVVYNPELLEGFNRGQIETDPPLLHYLQAEFTPTAERDGYIILKRRTSVP